MGVVEQERDPLASVPSPDHAAAARQDMDITDLTGCGIQFLILIPHTDKCIQPWWPGTADLGDDGAMSSL